MNEKKEFKMGEKIKQLRKEANMTQKELAGKVDVTDKTISKWKTNKGFPYMTTIPLLAKNFEVSPSFF